KSWRCKSCGSGWKRRLTAAVTRNASPSYTRCKSKLAAGRVRPTGGPDWRFSDQPVQTNYHQKQRADKGITLEKCAINAGYIQGSGTAVLVNERGGHDRHGEEIDGPKIRCETEPY